MKGGYTGDYIRVSSVVLSLRMSAAQQKVETAAVRFPVAGTKVQTKKESYTQCGGSIHVPRHILRCRLSCAFRDAVGVRRHQIQDPWKIHPGAARGLARSARHGHPALLARPLYRLLRGFLGVWTMPASCTSLEGLGASYSFTSPKSRIQILLAKLRVLSYWVPGSIAKKSEKSA